jgi:hypothetical protein
MMWGTCINLVAGLACIESRQHSYQRGAGAQPQRHPFNLIAGGLNINNLDV